MYELSGVHEFWSIPVRRRVITERHNRRQVQAGIRASAANHYSGGGFRRGGSILCRKWPTAW